MPPTYRIYINGELFSERTWIWGLDKYLTQTLQIDAPAGQYHVKIEAVQPCIAEFYSAGFKIEHGPAKWIDRDTLEIHHAS